jgi:hypothetical protein
MLIPYQLSQSSILIIPPMVKEKKKGRTFPISLSLYN